MNKGNALLIIIAAIILLVVLYCFLDTVTGILSSYGII